MGRRPALAERLNLLRHRLLRSFAQESYAQEGEDRILRRLFEGRRGGFYVDVGAHHPLRFSNTHIFYASGWSGVNIDAAPGSMALFLQLRPRDINLELAVGAPGPPRTLHIFDDQALNTFDPAQAAAYRASGYRVVNTAPVAVRPLGAILGEHVPPGRPIDFLSVDVEGLDLEVLGSNDWARFRPAVVLVETLGLDLEDALASPVARLLAEAGYRLCAKTPNTSIFRRR